jgi:DNA-binding CsgD family transcriptional regulator
MSPINEINPLRVLGIIRGRRGEAGAWQLLDDAMALADGTDEPLWSAPIRTARAELNWLSDRPDRAVSEIRTASNQLDDRRDRWMTGFVAVWMSRLGVPARLPGDRDLDEPFQLELAGEWDRAAAAWGKLSRPYDAAMVLLRSSEEDVLKYAVRKLDEMGARAAAAAGRRRMRGLGMLAIPRPARASTQASPARLTAREQEVLALVCEGISDQAIASRLGISDRTAHHHVSAVLHKLGVSSRAAAARQAARAGLSD